MKKVFTAVLSAMLIAPSAWADTYVIDPVHSSVSFRVKHVVGKVTGRFKQFEGSINYDPAKAAITSADATIQAATIDTGVDKRDADLRSPHYFDVQKYPTITFKSTGITGQQLQGQLTMHGVTKPVVLAFESGGVVKDPMGKQRLGGSATTHVNRNDFNIGASSGTMAAMVGADVEITLDIEAVKK